MPPPGWSAPASGWPPTSSMTRTAVPRWESTVRCPFQTKPELAIAIFADMVADKTLPPWCAGDEVRTGRRTSGSADLTDRTAALVAGPPRPTAARHPPGGQERRVRAPVCPIDRRHDADNLPTPRA